MSRSLVKYRFYHISDIAMQVTHFSSQILTTPSSSPATRYRFSSPTTFMQVTDESKRSPDMSSLGVEVLSFIRSVRDLRLTVPDTGISRRLSGELTIRGPNGSERGRDNHLTFVRCPFSFFDDYIDITRPLIELYASNPLSTCQQRITTRHVYRCASR